MNLPNKLTIARVIAVPFFIGAYYFSWYLLAFIIFVAASLTDMLDGKIARKYNLVTNFGKIMDPLADKVLVYSAICLMIPVYVPAWMLIIILAREFTVAGMRTVAASEGIVIAAGMNQDRSSDDSSLPFASGPCVPSLCSALVYSSGFPLGLTDHDGILGSGIRDSE